MAFALFLSSLLLDINIDAYGKVIRSLNTDVLYEGDADSESQESELSEEENFEEDSEESDSEGENSEEESNETASEEEASSESDSDEVDSEEEDSEEKDSEEEESEEKDSEEEDSEEKDSEEKDSEEENSEELDSEEDLQEGETTPREENITFFTILDFVRYSIEYQSNAQLYSKDIITLSLTDNTLPESYVSLGTASYPFDGKIYINTPYGDPSGSGEPWMFNLDKPLFAYVTDAVVINYSSDDHMNEPVQLELRKKVKDSTQTSILAPLFAQYVVDDGTNASANWKIKVAPYTDSIGNTNVYNFSGVIGALGPDASVKLNFVNDSIISDSVYANIESSGDIGLVCGAMNPGSKIELDLSGTNTFFNITSTVSGNAGGLVGTMVEGSELTINSIYDLSGSRIIEAVSGYAGGLVGYSNGGLISYPNGEGCTTINGTIKGTTGAGGLYGYYTNSAEVVDGTPVYQNVTFDLKNYSVNCTVQAASAGGLFGVLSGNADISVDGSGEGANTINVAGDTVSNFGGIAGTYSTNALANELFVNDVTVNTGASFAETGYYGGVTGLIGGDNASYIKVRDLTHNSSTGFADATAFGGVVGNAGDKGSMLDVGSVTIETGVVAEAAANGSAFKGGGIVGVLTDGVLRLSGTTDLTKAPSTPATAKSSETPEYKLSGQLVGIRTNSLVYATGSGNSEDANWVFNRSTTQVNADDIATWGSVLRIGGIESDVLTFDSSAHTVTVKAPVTTMTSAVDYTKTAINMQLNSGDKGALKFADGTNTKSALLGTNLSFSGTINLSGTGNIGLMRDDYKDSIDEIGAYTKTISGGTVTLSIGERYGSPSTGVGRGDIIAHRYNGLIACTDTGAEVSGITVDGTINVNATIDGTHVGGAVSDAQKGITLTNVTAQETINLNKISGSNHVVGGMVADVSGGNTGISGGIAKPTITLTGNIGDIPIGGIIGNVTNKNNTITAGSITVAVDINSSGASGGDVSCVGFISNISDGSMNLTGVTISGTKLNNVASNHAGGFLGYKWLGTDVNFTENNGVIVSGTNTLYTTAAYAAGLVQYATGHWTVSEKGINITGMSITGATNSLGLIVHDGYKEISTSRTDGLYLELTHKDSYYLGTGLTIPATTNYDELVRSTGSDILSNGGNGIISITTDGDLIMNGTSCNTYQNKYNTSNLSNNKSRYYYNLTSISAKKTNMSAGEKLLLWSLNKYAATNISNNFTNAFGTGAISGNFDLEHISYYPIDVGFDVTFGDATFKFYNNEIEASEAGTGDSDGGVRTTRDASQHYLMHSGIFRNVSKTLTTNGNMHFKGSIGADTTYSGVLINGTLSGTLTTSEEKELVLEGITISNTSKYLLINKLTTNSKMTLSGVRTGGGKDFSNTDKSSTETKYQAGATVASSLIGDVAGNGIQIKFSRMKLDSRTTAGSPSDLLAQYGTTKSIFSGATFLNTFAVDNNSTGTYDFAESLDWDNGNHNANVTYGQEIKTSVEYAGKQEKYFDQSNYVDPVTSPSSSRTSVYPFDSGFLPYVKNSTADGTSTTRELKINVSVEGLTEGCGTYNHPYAIRKGTQLVNVATAINKTGYPNNLRLPKIQGGNYASAISTHWCETKDTTCAEFEHGSGNYTYTEGGTTYTWTEDQVSLYLASAYYMVMGDITITGTYPGLGASPANDTSGKYAFRGVIVGAKSDGSVKISMSVSRPTQPEVSNFENTPGLITMSNGCVIKNLIIEVTPYTYTSNKYDYRVNGNQAYEYNEKFPNYGAAINKIMGGDNIIDNVKVNFLDNFRVCNGNDYKATVGGYVGCVVNGGLIFRNVTDASLTNFVVKKVNTSGTIQNVTCNGNKITNLTDEKDLIHIHINPFVGRVINGYAIREINSYGFSEDGATYGDGESRANAVEVTMHNTRKNYSIPDIDTTNTDKLTFSQSTVGGSYDTISVPNSQALYIMSIIAQSGSGCASTDSGDYTYNISYCGSKYRNYSSATSGNNNAIDNNKATHWANYSNIGDNTKGVDYNLSINDTINSKKAVPYIIHKYTSAYTLGTTTYYPARTLTRRTFYVNLVSGTTYYLPDSFRGIGFLGSNNLDDNMKIYGFNGNGTTAKPTIIDINTEYFVNKQTMDPYFGSNLNATYSVGIGLFNNLRQSSSTGFDRKYENDSKYHISSFTLQGYLSAHHVSDYGADQNASPTNNRDGTFMDTAGLVPNILSNDVTLYNFSNILFKKLHINSYAYAGGFVAFTNNSGAMIYINNCNADGFKVEGSGRIAGFVGSFDTNINDNSGIHINTGLDSSGKDSFTSVMKNTIINNRLSTDVKQNYTAGILGCVYSSVNSSTIPADNGDNARGHLILRNVTIEGGNAETNYIGNKNNPNGSSGGILGGGSARVNGCLIQNCTVKNIDIYGRHAGGIMGENSNFKTTMKPPSVTSARIVGCTVVGELDENNAPQYSIVALQYAGGVYGSTCDSGEKNAKYKSVSEGDSDYVEYKTDIDGVYVYGYNICSRNTDNSNESTINSSFAAGGITGNNDNNRKIQNCKIEKCVIDVGTNADSATNTPSGGLIGRMNSGILYGYNIEVKDCDFQTHQWVAETTVDDEVVPAHADNIQKAYTYTDENNVEHTPVSGMKCGNFIGNGNSKTVNLTAVHSENNPASTDFNDVETASSFIVYADYLDAASGNKAGKEMSSLSSFDSSDSNVTEGGLKQYFPHVNVSPVQKMGTSAIITGDGAALYYKEGVSQNSGTEQKPNTPIIEKVVSGEKYSVPGASVKTDINNALSAGEDSNRISTYYNEMGSLPDGVDDFTVIVINTEVQNDSTDLINNYIKMVTNTNADYTVAENSDKYKIKIYPCSYDSTTTSPTYGNYVINATGKIKGLNYSSETKKYYMANGYADSNQGDYQFSLIDVQYLNPSNSNEVAYHLYVPVLTRKMLMFGFKSASLSGTDIKNSNFSNYGNTLAESLDSWYTGYVHYTYSLSEIQGLIDSGTGLDWNNNKVVQLKYTTTTVGQKLSGDTQVVVINPYNQDKYYYSTLSALRSIPDADGEQDMLSFARFKTKADGTGSSFTTPTLQTLMDLQGFTLSIQTATLGTSGYVYVHDENATSTDTVIIVNGNKYKYVGEGKGDVKITIQAPSEAEMSDDPEPEPLLKEDYYVCIRAKGDSVYNYSIRTPATISGEGNPTIRVSNLKESDVTKVIMGNLYVQDFSATVRNNDTTQQEINATNHRLDVSMTSMISLRGTDDNKDFILTHLSNENIHLYHSFIVTLTAKDSTGTRTDILGSPDVTTSFGFSGNGHTGTDQVNQNDVSGNYILLKEHDIKQYLSKNGYAVINTTSYIMFDEEWQYNLEFPIQDETDPTVGVNVSAVSNLSYNTESLAYSNMTKSMDTPSPNYYYRKDSEGAKLVYNMKSGILDEFDEAGASSFNYSQQGINPKNFVNKEQTRLPVETVATYDATKVKHAEFATAQKIKYSIILYKKTDSVGGDVNYVPVDNISEYFDLMEEKSVFLKVGSGVTSEYASGGKMIRSSNPAELVYTADLDQSFFAKAEDQMIDSEIDFSVITGEGFDDYANYKVVLTVDLLKQDNTPVSSTSNATDWVIYTNARINPNMLTISETN